MKRLILSAACALSLVSCGGPPAGPNQNVGQPVPKSETKLTAPTIKEMCIRDRGYDVVVVADLHVGHRIGQLYFLADVGVWNAVVVDVFV